MRCLSLTRYLLSLAAALLVVGVCARPAQASFILHKPSALGVNNGLVGWWTFDGKDMAGAVGSQRTAYDRSGSSNHGKYWNATDTPPAIGKIGQGMQFDGVDDYVDLGDQASHRPSDAITVCGWAKYTDTASKNDPGIITKEYTQGVAPYVSYKLSAGGDAGGSVSDYKPQIFVNISGTTYTIQTATVLSPGVWYHLCGTWSSGNKIRLFLNGAFIAENTTARSGTISYNSGKNLSIGREAAYAGSASYFKRSIDDARVYNRALYADEIKRLYNLGGTVKLNKSLSTDSLSQGLVGWWTFDGKDISGVQAYDRSGNGNRGTLTSGPERTIGKIGQGMTFDGMDDYVQIPYNASLVPSQFTISAWVKRTGSCSSTPNFRAIYRSSSGNGQTAGWALICTDTEQAQLRWGDGAVQDGFLRVTPTILSLNTWHHVIASCDGTAMSLYQDGQLYAQDSTVTLAYSSNDVTYIAKSNGISNFLGSMDDIRLYNCALSADEIKRLYNMGR